MLEDFTQLDVWQESMDLSVEIYELSKKFPKEELYGFTSQIRRSSLSVPTNIAEGFGRYTFLDKRNKYIQSRGELYETMSLLHYGERIQCINTENKDKLLNRYRITLKKLNALISKMEKLHTSNPKSNVPSPKSIS